MGRALDRLPVDYAEGRTTKVRAPARNTDLGHDADATLSMPVRTAEEQAARDAAAVANLNLFGAADLAEMLGLTGPPPVPAPADPKQQLCPQCQQPPGARCKSQGGKFLGKPHRVRHRRAETGHPTDEELNEESA